MGREATRQPLASGETACTPLARGGETWAVEASMCLIATLQITTGLLQHELDLVLDAVQDPEHTGSYYWVLITADFSTWILFNNELYVTLFFFLAYFSKEFISTTYSPLFVRQEFWYGQL